MHPAPGCIVRGVVVRVEQPVPSGTVVTARASRRRVGSLNAAVVQGGRAGDGDEVGARCGRSTGLVPVEPMRWTSGAAWSGGAIERAEAL